MKNVILTFLVLVAAGYCITGCDGVYDGGSGCDEASNSSGTSGSNVSPNNGSINIESTYAAGGSAAVTTTTVSGYQIFHHRKMNGNHPIITWGNGT